MTPRRHVARVIRTVARASAIVPLGVVASWNLVAAQVGHPPGHSPFHDLPRGAGPTIAFGYFGGDAGDAGVGPLSGTAWEARYELSLGGPVVITLGGSYFQTKRYIVDPYKDSMSRRSEQPYDNDVVGVDVGLQVRLTGAKTWHGLAPHVGVALGLATGSTLAGDTSEYDFRTKFTIAPGVGVRWYPTRRLYARLDARALLWRLRYPDTFHFPSPVDGSRVVPLTRPLTEWTRHPWISLGVGWTF
jgi:hypothetical protein